MVSVLYWTWKNGRWSIARFGQPSETNRPAGILSTLASFLLHQPGEGGTPSCHGLTPFRPEVGSGPGWTAQRDAFRWMARFRSRRGQSWPLGLSSKGCEAHGYGRTAVSRWKSIQGWKAYPMLSAPPHRSWHYSSHHRSEPLRWHVPRCQTPSLPPRIWCLVPNRRLSCPWVQTLWHRWGLREGDRRRSGTEPLGQIRWRRPGLRWSQTSCERIQSTLQTCWLRRWGTRYRLTTTTGVGTCQHWGQEFGPCPIWWCPLIWLTCWTPSGWTYLEGCIQGLFVMCLCRPDACPDATVQVVYGETFEDEEAIPSGNTTGWGGPGLRMHAAVCLRVSGLRWAAYWHGRNHQVVVAIVVSIGARCFRLVLGSGGLGRAFPRRAPKCTGGGRITTISRGKSCGWGGRGGLSRCSFHGAFPEPAH